MRDERTPGRSIDLARLEAILDAYGGREEAWPADERQSVLTLLAASEEARAMRQEAEELDRMLANAPVHDPSSALLARVVESAPTRLSWMDRLDQWASLMWPIGRNWQPAAGLALAAVLGIVVGFALPNSSATTTQTTDLSELAFAEYVDFGEVP